MSELEEQFLQARRVAFAIVAGQLGLTLLVSAASLLLGGSKAGVSAFMGGCIGTLASLYMVVSMFRLGKGAEPAKILHRVYRGEFYKLAVTAALFALVLSSMEVSFGAMLSGFAATLIAYWAVLRLRLAAMTQTGT